MQERLQKLIAAAGVCSRRKAEELILAGEVRVNGQVVTRLGTKADPDGDHIKVCGKLINPKLAHQPKVYFLLNKPAGFLSSKSDPEGRPVVTRLLPNLRQEVHPVGRLDFKSEGLLLLTNDGELTDRLTAAKYHVPKTYLVKVKGIPEEKQLALLRHGIRIEGRRTAPAQIEQLERTTSNCWFSVTLAEGRNQQIRKMFRQIGHSVLKLRRVAIGPLTDVGLPVGKARRLTQEEVSELKQAGGLGKVQNEKGKMKNAKKRSQRMRRQMTTYLPPAGSIFHFALFLFHFLLPF